MPAAVELVHPHETLMRFVNPALRVAVRVPGLGSALKDFMVVNFTGRKSGRQFSVPVSAHRLDGDLYAILEAGWKHNFTDGAPAEVRHAGRTTAMQGQLIKDPATVADIAHRLATGYGPKKAQLLMGLNFTAGTVPTVDEFAEAATRLKLAAIRLTPRN